MRTLFLLWFPAIKLVLGFFWAGLSYLLQPATFCTIHSLHSLFYIWFVELFVPAYMLVWLPTFGWIIYYQPACHSWLVELFISNQLVTQFVLPLTGWIISCSLHAAHNFLYLWWPDRQEHCWPWCGLWCLEYWSGHVGSRVTNLCQIVSSVMWVFICLFVFLHGAESLRGVMPTTNLVDLV